MWLIVIALVICVSIMGYAIYNLSDKLEAQEDISNVRGEWFIEMKRRINLVKSELEILDVRGSFSSDDEIGFFFKEVQKMSDFLDETLVVEENTNQQKT